MNEIPTEDQLRASLSLLTELAQQVLNTYPPIQRMEFGTVVQKHLDRLDAGLKRYKDLTEQNPKEDELTK